MLRLARKFLSILLTLVIVTTGGLQAARAAFDAPIAGHTGHGLAVGHSSDKAISRSTSMQRDKSSRRPAGQRDCFTYCLDALPDQYLPAAEVRTLQFDQPILYPAPLHPEPNCLTANLLVDRYSTARGPPLRGRCDLADPRQVLLLTLRLRI